MSKMGSPTKYTEDMPDKVQGYIDGYKEKGHPIPTIEGLSLILGISRETIYAWCKQEEKKHFSDMVEQLLATQSHELVANGLEGKFNASITKLMMHNHGYHEQSKVDHTTKGESLNKDDEAIIQRALEKYKEQNNVNA